MFKKFLTLTVRTLSNKAYLAYVYYLFLVTFKNYKIKLFLKYTKEMKLFIEKIYAHIYFYSQ